MLETRLSRLLFKYFPPPAYLLSAAHGLDISDQSLKFAQIIPTSDGLTLKKYGERKIPPGIIESGKIKNTAKLEEVLRSLREEEKMHFVRVSLPEEQVYLFPLKLDKEGLKSVREGIELALEEHVPLPAEEAVFDYEIVHQDDNGLEIQVAATSEKMLGNYLAVFRDSFISLQSLELEAQAIARAVIKKGDMDTYIIVDFGHTRTGIFIVSRGVVVFTSTLDIGGVSLHSAIEKNFKVTPEEAEKMKQDYGLARNTDNKEVFPVILNSVSVIRDEIIKRLFYWKTHKDEEGKDHLPIKKIILCGGEANLIGLTEYLAQSIKCDVEIGNVWVNMMDIEKEVPPISRRESLGYATAIGLALGDFYND